MKANKKVLGVAALAAMAAMGGTFAYFNQTMTVENPFDTAKYGTVTVEDFKPEEGKDWKPGVEVNKDVNVVNTGDQSVVVRMKFKDTWTGLHSDAEVDGEEQKYELSSKDSVIWNESQLDSKDGLVKGDKSVVEKKFENDGDWAYNEDDGYYYYTKQLEPGTGTDTFLTSVRLLDDTDMGKYETNYYWTENANAQVTDLSQWTLYGTDKNDGQYTQIQVPEKAVRNCAITNYEDGKGGYSDADYTLTITIQTVQATDKAVLSTFVTDDGGEFKVPDSIVQGWKLTAEDLTTGTATQS